MEITAQSKECNKSNYITAENVELIVSKHDVANGDTVVGYTIHNASDKMLGFQCDYWKLKVRLSSKRVMHYFLKLISVSNEAKAKMMKDLNLFTKESYFYAEIKQKIQINDLRPWSAPFVTSLGNVMVFEDLHEKKYKLRNKLIRFDKAHTLEALKTLSRFHASSIIYEEKKSKELGAYSLKQEFDDYLDRVAYENTNAWFSQSREAGLAAIKEFAGFSKTDMYEIESRWFDVWSSALSESGQSSHHKNVICHCDLWNNNLMFHYQDNKPDDCVLVDFQAICYQPPARDVMLLLYCNLDPTFREENMEMFLNFYINELHLILVDNGVDPRVLTKQEFFESAKLQRQWGLIAWACLVQLSCIDDDTTTSIFTDTFLFEKILLKDRTTFVNNMIQAHPCYKERLMETFIEIVERYCL